MESLCDGERRRREVQHVRREGRLLSRSHLQGLQEDLQGENRVKGGGKSRDALTLIVGVNVAPSDCRRFFD